MQQKVKRITPPFLNAFKFKDKIGIIDTHGRHSYNNLLMQSQKLSKTMLNVSPSGSIVNPFCMHNQKVAFLCSNDHTYVNAQWATWMLGATAVPLSKFHPLKELEYIVTDSSPKLLVGTSSYASILSEIGEKLNINLVLFEPNLSEDSEIKFKNFRKETLPEKVLSDSSFEKIWEEIDWDDTNAHIVYTSGTTGQPKGVITTFPNLFSQVEDINSTWDVSPDDGYLHVLPLHHVHGIVNNLVSPLTAGACVTMLDGFSAKQVWSHLLENDNVNVFHAVPTIYSLLIEYHEKMTKKKQESISETLSNKLRFMVSGSAALPVPVLKKWQNISGHFLLERYGMTEIGMALTNPLNGKRVEGSVGKPFPSVMIRIITDDGKTVLCEGDNENITKYKDGVGTLEIKGTSVFKGYLNREDTTKESFTTDGWFKTGDTATYDSEEDVIRILGRTSVDIIKHGGYKISALEIEKHLLSISGIKEAAVVGLPDDIFGEIICAILVTSGQIGIDLKYIEENCRDKMAKYKFPTQLKIVRQIPKNAMGKVNKKELKSTLF